MASIDKIMERQYSDSESSDTDLALREDDGWEDAEQDQEDISIVSLFDENVFPDVQSMIEYCKTSKDFDLVAVIQSLNLDFYGRIKLVNYIRDEVKKGNKKPDVSSIGRFSDDKYLQPVLEDDALLFSLDDLDLGESGNGDAPSTQNSTAENHVDANLRIKELEEKLNQQQYQFAEYRKTVQATLDKRWQDLDTTDKGPVNLDKEGKSSERDAEYFDSYSYNDIHETMLKDTVRTDAYRDFIYENKHLFEGKIVLDVGCGTGILSMFCAKAGAAKVFAVDNSSIIDKARINIEKNGMSDKIVCIRGKIEDITLPTEKVDIIVSEWMGYCLLFEAMLNSVLWARDKYLQPDGLMVPSHCSLHIAPLMDPEYVSDNVEFWYDVYGFDMSAMMEKIYDDVLIRSVKPQSLAAPSSPFLTLPLRDVTVKDLTFRRNFSVEIKENIESIDGFVLWFDTFFLPGRSTPLPMDARAEAWRQSNRPGVAFTTGPGGRETHWQSGVMLIDRKKHPPKAMPSGTKISGTVGYAEAGSNKRGLELELTWNVEGSAEHGQQLWYLQ